MLNSTTNYEIYKSLYSSHNDRNYFEIAYTLNRQFGEAGVYKDLVFYNFADNHDTTRIASILTDWAHLYPLYAILFTMPGIPSVYYGSEWGTQGIKGEHEDTLLRPRIAQIPDLSGCPLYAYVRQLASIRQKLVALQDGGYKELFVAAQQLVFERSSGNSIIIVAVNSAPNTVSLHLKKCRPEHRAFADILDGSFCTETYSRDLFIADIPGHGARILRSVQES